MLFTPPLIKGALLKRYKRFFADVMLDSPQGLVTAHCPNTGSMLGLNQSGQTVWLSRASNPLRKLAYTWELVEEGELFIGVNTQTPNRLAKEALEKEMIPELAGYHQIKAEVRYGENSRIDFLLTHPNRPACYVEVKNVHYKVGDQAQFPDSVTQRGAKHMKEMGFLVQQGLRAVILYVVQREDCTSFDLAYDLDPTYAQAALQAFLLGVESLAYGCRLSSEAILLDKRLVIPTRPL